MPRRLSCVSCVIQHLSHQHVGLRCQSTSVPSVETVSYTHLDVYKRQMQKRLTASNYYYAKFALLWFIKTQMSISDSVRYVGCLYERLEWRFVVLCECNCVFLTDDLTWKLLLFVLIVSTGYLLKVGKLVLHECYFIYTCYIYCIVDLSSA